VDSGGLFGISFNMLSKCKRKYSVLHTSFFAYLLLVHNNVLKLPAALVNHFVLCIYVL
jgi:hypothetical protein